MNQPDIYRPKSSLILAGVGFVLVSIFVWASFYQGGTSTEITSTLVAAFVVTCLYLLFIKPKITFEEGGVIISNPIEKITIGWADVIEIQARWAMAISTEKFVAIAWAAPAPTLHSSRNIRSAEIVGLGIDLDGSIRLADSPRSDSGAATYMARTALKRFQSKPEVLSLPTHRKHDFRVASMAAIFLSAAITVNILGH